MRAGKLRHLIQVDQPSLSQSDAGEELVTWTPAFVSRGAIEPLAGREALRAGEILAEADTKIILRWSLQTAQITAKWRMRYAGIIFNLKIVSPVDFRRSEIEIFASSGLNAG